MKIIDPLDPQAQVVIGRIHRLCAALNGQAIDGSEDDLSPPTDGCFGEDIVAKEGDGPCDARCQHFWRTACSGRWVSHDRGNEPADAMLARIGAGWDGPKAPSSKRRAVPPSAVAG